MEKLIIAFSAARNTGKDFIADILVKNHKSLKISLSDPAKRFLKEVFEFSEEQLWGPSENRDLPDSRYLMGWKLRCGCLVDSWEKKEEGFKINQVIDFCHLHKNGFHGWMHHHVFDRYDFSGKEITFPTPKYLTVRLALRQFLSGAGRSLYQNTWVDYCLKEIDKISTGEWHYDPRWGSWQEEDLPIPFTSIVIPDVRFRNEFDSLKKRGVKLVRIKPDPKQISNFDETSILHQSESEQKSILDSEFDYILQNDFDFTNLQNNIKEMLAILSPKLKLSGDAVVLYEEPFVLHEKAARETLELMRKISQKERLASS